jgi:hypothetical protein
VKKKKIFARVIPSNIYGRIIEVNVPMRLYWDKAGGFDGIEYNVKDCTSYQRKLIREVVGIIGAMQEMLQDMTEAMKEDTPLPAFLKKAFPDEFSNNEPV